MCGGRAESAAAADATAVRVPLLAVLHGSITPSESMAGAHDSTQGLLGVVWASRVCITACKSVGQSSRASSCIMDGLKLQRNLPINQQQELMDRQLPQQNKVGT